MIIRHYAHGRVGTSSLLNAAPTARTPTCPCPQHNWKSCFLLFLQLKTGVQQELISYVSGTLTTSALRQPAITSRPRVHAAATTLHVGAQLLYLSTHHVVLFSHFTIFVILPMPDCLKKHGRSHTSGGMSFFSMKLKRQIIQDFRHHDRNDSHVHWRRAPSTLLYGPYRLSSGWWSLLDHAASPSSHVRTHWPGKVLS